MAPVAPRAFGILPSGTLQMAMYVTIDGYDSLEQVGVGGMAAVYKARKTSIDKVVAIKVLFPYLAGDGSFIERFQREARAAARIQHENIVNVIDFGESDGSYYIVMEYYDGRTLEDVLKDRRELPLDIAIQILLEVCYGLDSAHSHDTVHRDIKPGNIIVTNQGGIKIADFGLAKKSDATSMITQEGKVIGTPAYMSPEQAAGEVVGPQSDIFSLGVVAYEMLGQQKPFAGKSYSEVLEKIQTFEPLSVASVNPLVHPDFENIVSKMLDKDRDKRYQSAKEVIVDVEKAMEKFRMPRDRRNLASYARDPAAYEKVFREKMINRCLSQGAFYMKKGQSRLEEATLEFKRILFLDPENERARKNLDRIVELKGRDGTVTTLTPARPVNASGDGGHGTKNTNKPKKDKKHKSVTVVAAGSGASRRGRAAGKTVGGLAAALLVLAGGWFAYQRGLFPSLELPGQSGNKPPVLSVPKKVSVTGGERIEFALQSVDAEGDEVLYRSDELPRGATLSETGEFQWKVDYNQTGRHKIEFYADDGTSESVSETIIEVQPASIRIDFEKIGAVRADAGKRFSRALSATSTSGSRVRYSLVKGPEGMRVENGRLVWIPGAESSGKHTAVLKATDGYVTAKQTVTLNVRSVAEQETETAQVEWQLPEKSNVYVDGDLKERDTRRFRASLPRGHYTLRAELLDGTTGWVETLDLNPGEDVKLEAAKLEYGSLSVYFLGGVGEFRVNGGLFKHQPPFSGVKVPVGTHRVSCKMAGEFKAREIEITIEKGQETVIEYEVGSDPVVTIDE
jgi:serine/threonine protein kinase